MTNVTIGAIIGKPGSSTENKTGSWSVYKPILVRKTPPCTNACPAGIDVRGYVTLIRAKRFKEALELVKEKIPFPVVVGRVCNHPCEEKCYRGKVDEPIAICALKRFVAEDETNNKSEKPLRIKSKKKGRVAIVGSGPAGLSAAYRLAQIGYSVTIFEALPVKGGCCGLVFPITDCLKIFWRRK